MSSLLAGSLRSRISRVVAVVTILASVQMVAGQSDESTAYRGYLGTFKVLYVGGIVESNPYIHLKLKAGDKLSIDIGSNESPAAMYSTGATGVVMNVVDIRDQIILNKGRNPIQEVGNFEVTEISFGPGVPQRVGNAIGTVISQGKSGNRYIGLIWAEHRDKCGAVFQVDENDYPPLLAALERFTGKKPVDSEKP